MNYEPGKGLWKVSISYGDGAGMETFRSSFDGAMRLVAEEHVQRGVKEATVSYMTILDALIKS